MHRGLVVALVLIMLGSIITPAPPRPSERSQPDQLTGAYEGILEFAIGTDDEPGDIDRFWSDIFDRLESAPEYRSPRELIPYDAERLPASACMSRAQAAQLLNNAFYCPPDELLAWDDDWLRRLHQLDGFAFAPLAIIAHEWGHHVQTLLGRRVTGLAAELQADCYASLYLEDAVTSGELDLDDWAYTQIQLYLLGNLAFRDSAWFSPAEHGSPSLRALAAIAGTVTAGLNTLLEMNDPAGWHADLSYCRDFETEDFAPMQAVKVGPFAVNEFPNSTTTLNNNGSIEIIHPVATTRITFLPGLVLGTPPLYFDQMRDAYFDDRSASAPRLIGDPQPLGFISSRVALVQTYELAETRAGETALAHGIIALDVLPGVGGLLVDVFHHGPAPENGEDWAPFLIHLFAFSQMTCSPDEQAFTACLFSELNQLGLPEITVRSSQAGIVLDQPVVDAGPTLVTFVNNDMVNLLSGGPAPIATAFVLVQLSDTLDLAPTRPPEEAPAAGSASTPDWFYEATMLGGPFTLGAFSQTQAVVDLTPGEWVVVGYPYLTPISPPFTVRESAADTAPFHPPVSAEITLDEDGATGLDAVEPGHQVWRVSNEGDEPHELQVYRFPSGVTPAQIDLWAAYVSSPSGTEPPDGLGFDPEADVVRERPFLAAISTGQSVVIELMNLPAGTYVAICFVTDEQTGDRHWERGEATLFTVGSRLEFG